MNLVRIFSLVSILLMPLMAEMSTYGILITKTSQESHLKQIKKKLDGLNIKMYVQDLHEYYYVYSPSYSNEDDAKYDLQKIKNYFPSAILLVPTSTHLKISQEVIQDQEIKKNEDAVLIVSQVNELEVVEKELNDFFINVAIGSSSISGSTDNATALDISNDAITYTLEAGYCFTDNINLTLAYLNASSNDISLHNFYTSLNYSFYLSNSLELYLGGVLGYSSLELTVASLQSGDPAYSALFGGQFGVNYDVLKNLYLYTAYQGMMLDHKIILDATSNIEFTFLHNVQLGFGYRF